MTLLENTVSKSRLILMEAILYTISVSYTILANQNGAFNDVYGLSAAINTVFFEQQILHLKLVFAIQKDSFGLNNHLGHIPHYLIRVNLKYNFKKWDFSLRTLFNNIKSSNILVLVMLTIN